MNGIIGKSIRKLRSLPAILIETEPGIVKEFY